MHMPNESIFKPAPLQDFSYKDLVVIPADVPSRALKKRLAHRSYRSRSILFSHLFYFDRHAVLYGGIGAPGMILVLEPLLVSGIQRVVFLGLAGSLTSRLPVKSAAVVNSALSEEGTSRHYFPKKNLFSASSKVCSQIHSFLKKNYLPYADAAAVTTDAPYRETPEWISKQIKQGCELVDMEISAVFALCEYYQVQAGAVMLISDQLSQHAHNQQFHKLDDSIRSYFFPFIDNHNFFI